MEGRRRPRRRPDLDALGIGTEDEVDAGAEGASDARWFPVGIQRDHDGPRTFAGSGWESEIGGVLVDPGRDHRDEAEPVRRQARPRTVEGSPLPVRLDEDHDPRLRGQRSDVGREGAELPELIRGQGRLPAPPHGCTGSHETDRRRQRSRDGEGGEEAPTASFEEVAGRERSEHDRDRDPESESGPTVGRERQLEEEPGHDADDREGCPDAQEDPGGPTPPIGDEECRPDGGERDRDRKGERGEAQLHPPRRARAGGIDLGQTCGALRRQEEETDHADHRADREHPGEPPEGHAWRSIPFVTEADGADDGHHPEDRDEQEREHPMQEDRSDDEDGSGPDAAATAGDLERHDRSRHRDHIESEIRGVADGRPRDECRATDRDGDDAGANASLQCPIGGERAGCETQRGREQSRRQPHERQGREARRRSKEAQHEGVSGAIAEGLGGVRHVRSEGRDPQIVDHVGPPDIRGRVHAERHRRRIGHERGQIDRRDDPRGEHHRDQNLEPGLPRERAFPSETSAISLDPFVHVVGERPDLTSKIVVPPSDPVTARRAGCGSSGCPGSSRCPRWSSRPPPAGVGNLDSS